MRRYALRFSALGYLALLLLIPLGMVFYRAFEHGLAPAWHAVTTHEALHALYLSLLITAIVVPLNTVFGVITALTIVRHPFRGKGLVNAFVDLPRQVLNCCPPAHASHTGVAGGAAGLSLLRTWERGSPQPRSPPCTT